MTCMLTLLLSTAIMVAQVRRDAAGDWPMFNRDLAGTRYSPLKQIDTANVARLTQAWSYRLQPEGKALIG